MPSKIYEAAGMAKPIILGIKGFAAEFVRSANAGMIIEPENAEQLVDAVVHLARNPHLRLQFGKSGYEYVKENYDRADLARKYLDIITTVADPAIEAVPASQTSTTIRK
jgi:glycosyltransferase involved in cell wall biosynthesis